MRRFIDSSFLIVAIMATMITTINTSCKSNDMAAATNTAAEDLKALMIAGLLLTETGVTAVCPLCGALAGGYMAAKESAKAGNQRYSNEYPGAFCDTAILAPVRIYQESNPMEWVGLLHNYTINEYHRFNMETNTRNMTLVPYASDQYTYLQTVVTNLSGVPNAAKDYIRDSINAFEQTVEDINSDFNSLMALEFNVCLDTVIARFDRFGFSDVSDYLLAFKENTELQQAVEDWDAETFNSEITSEIATVMTSNFATNEKNIILSLLSLYKYSFNYWIQLQAP